MDASGHDRVKWEETRHRKRESRPVLQTKHCKKGLVRAQTQASDPKVRVWAKPVRPVLPVIGPRCKIRKQKLRERGPRGRFVWGWCTGTTQRDGMGREEGGGFRMGNTCIPVADSF